MLLSAVTFSSIETLSLSAVIAPSKTIGPIVAAKELATPAAAVEPSPAIAPLEAPREPAIGPKIAIARIPASKAPTPTAAARLATTSSAPPASSSYIAIYSRTN